MQSVVRWYPLAYDIRVEVIPIPKIEHPDDAIVKVKLAGLCGSDLHIYRGTAGMKEPAVCGHEFIGEVVALGASFHPGATGRPHLYSVLKVGDNVISPFTASFIVALASPADVPRVNFSGLQTLQGGKLIGFDTNTIGKEMIEKLTDPSLLLLCDILPTGVFAAFQALNHPKTLPILTSRPYPQSSSSSLTESGISPLMRAEDKLLTVAVVGLGPVGVCACVALLDMLCTRDIQFRMIAIDPTESRRKKVEAIYAKVLQAYGKQPDGQFDATDIATGKDIVARWTNGIGCNSVLEAVGNTSALSLSYELVRPFGCITSVGVHEDSKIPYTGRQLYDKNVSLDFGRCPVRAMFPMALELLLRRQDVFGEVGGESSLVEKIVGFDVAAKAYEDFDKGRCGKVLFDPWK